MLVWWLTFFFCFPKRNFLTLRATIIERGVGSLLKKVHKMKWDEFRDEKLQGRKWGDFYTITHFFNHSSLDFFFLFFVLPIKIKMSQSKWDLLIEERWEFLNFHTVSLALSISPLNPWQRRRRRCRFWVRQPRWPPWIGPEGSHTPCRRDWLQMWGDLAQSINDSPQLLPLLKT